MKRWIRCIQVLFLLSLFVGCGGKVNEVGILQWDPSLIYSDSDIEDAIDVILYEFDRHWDGCTLKEIAYAGDAVSMDHMEWAQRYEADDVIVLTSSFDVDSSGGDGSLNPDSTYGNWMWILVRKDNGKWKHVDHGY